MLALPGSATTLTKASVGGVLPTLGPSPGRLNRSLALLESEAHAIRLQIQTKEQIDKATPKTYSRQYNSYATWWDISQAEKVKQNRDLVALPAMPIFAAKVVPFLLSESTREKKKRGSAGETIAGSSVGKSQISQVISALEQYRRDSQHLYKDCAEAQIPLRHDQRIRQFESASKKDEPKRAEKAQVTKAAGSSSGKLLSRSRSFNQA
ncbi:hypothetical protein DFH06DRAFT_1138595 [Mycena polygramma]|nr:hypothetical protein DFH06DRAFT_1138595 [Mycena polygramma]